MPILERNIEHAVCSWASEHGFLCLKIRDVVNGFPDRLFISPNGHTVFIEFKKPGEKPRKLQVHRISELTRRGVPAFWSDNEFECISYLKACLDTAPIPGESNTDASVSGLRGLIPGPGTGED